MKQGLRLGIVVLLSLTLTFFSIIGIRSTISQRPDVGAEVAKYQDSISLLKLEIDMKQTVIDEQVRALKAQEEVINKIMKGLE